MEDMLKISGVVKESIVDGPGIRYVVFTQGCPHNCKGCHNPQTHNIEGGRYVKISDIVDDIKKNPLLKGITISGGEPFMQANQVAKLISKLDKDRYDIITYTGFEYEYLLNNGNDVNGYLNLLNSTDILIDGKFDIDKRSISVPFRGSTNQRAIDVKSSLSKNEVCLYDFEKRRSLCYV